MINVGVITSFVISLDIVTFWSSRRSVSICLFLLCFLHVCLLIFLLRWTFGRILTSNVAWFFFRETAVLSYSLKVAWLNQTWNGRYTRSTSWSCWLSAIENPASSNRRQRAVSWFFRSKRPMRWRSYMRWVLLKSSTITLSISIYNQWSSCVQINRLILTETLVNLILILCLRFLWWESPQLVLLKGAFLRCSFCTCTLRLKRSFWRIAGSSNTLWEWVEITIFYYTWNKSRILFSMVWIEFAHELTILIKS